MGYYSKIWEHVDGVPEYIGTEWLQPETAREFEGGTGTWFNNTSGATLFVGTMAHRGNQSMLIRVGSARTDGNNWAQYTIGTIEHNKIATLSWRQYFGSYVGYFIVQAFLSSPAGGSVFRWDSSFADYTGTEWRHVASTFPTGTFDQINIYTWYPSMGSASYIFVDDVSLKT